MVFRLVQYYVFISTWISLGFLVSAVRMIKKIGLSSKYYPERYIEPKRWMKKLLKIKLKSIPRFLYFELVSTVIFAVCFPIVIVLIFAVFGVNESLMRLLNVFLAVYMLSDSVIMVIFFKRSQ